MILADTGYFIALLNPRDDLRSRARNWAASSPEMLIVTEYGLWETVNSCSKGVNRTKLHRLVGEVRSAIGYVFIPASAELFDAGLMLHGQRPDKTWSLTDCISFVVMQRRGITRALAYDHHFEQAGFEALLRRDPTP
jgi:uncharacterized protein